MRYEDFVENYSPELQLLDALDDIKNYSLSAAEMLDQMVSHSNSEQNDEPLPQKDPSR